MDGYERYKYKLSYQDGHLAKVQDFHFYQGNWSEHKDEALLFLKDGMFENNCQNLSNGLFKGRKLKETESFL